MKRLLSLLTTITLLINTLSLLAVPVSAATVSDFVYENYSVKYTVKSEKVQTKTIEITLKNTGKEAMYSWALGFDATGKISGLKGAEIYGNEETSYILRNTDKNFELAAGKSVVIGYTLTGAKLAAPKLFELMSYRVFAEEGFDAKLHRDDKKIETFEGGVVPDDEIIYVFSHELGHTFGLADAYASINDGYQIYTNYIDPNLEFPVINESKRDSFESGEIMVFDGLPCSNDIEMILQAFIEEQTQWFYVDSELIKIDEKHISKAIKNPIIIYEKKEVIRIINVEKREDKKETITTYHEYRQYESDEIYEIEPPPKY